MKTMCYPDSEARREQPLALRAPDRISAFACWIPHGCSCFRAMRHHRRVVN